MCKQVDADGDFLIVECDDFSGNKIDVSKREKSQKHDVLCGARRRAVFVFVSFVVLLVLFGERMVTHTLQQIANKQRQHSNQEQDDNVVQLPSLNLFDYEKDCKYPVFPKSYPTGLERKIMPQLPERNGKENQVWTNFYMNIGINGGSVMEEMIDLRFTKPLQSELSGHIVFNILFGEGGEKVRKRLEDNPNFFSEHVILVRTPKDLIAKNGEAIPAGTLFNLDGHHTNQVLKLCAKIDHPNLRHGYIDPAKHICGKHFSTVQKVVVIEQLHPLVVIELAMEAGAGSGHGLNPGA